MEWRKKWKADTLLQDYKVPEVLKKYYPGGLAGYDKEGCPVWMAESANFDLKGKLQYLNAQCLLQYRIHIPIPICGTS